MQDSKLSMNRGINVMSLTFLFLLNVFANQDLAAQDSDLTKKLNEIGLDISIVDNILYKSNLSFDFKMRTAMRSPKDSVVLIANYTSANKLGQRWLLESVNGVKPSQKQIEDFYREYNTTIPKKQVKAIRESISVKKEDDKFIYLECAFDQNSMSIDNYFLAKSMIVLKIDKIKKKLISAKLNSTESTIIKSWNADNYLIEIIYAYTESGKIIVEEINADITVSLMGEKRKITDQIHYYQFQEVK